MKIVLVDDNPINLAVLGSVCAKIESAEWVSFGDAEQSIAYLMVNPVDLIIVDYSMPRITGIELIKRLRASPRHGHTPIIVLTSSSELSVRRRAFEVGATEFISKPVRPPELLARIKTALERASQLDVAAGAF